MKRIATPVLVLTLAAGSMMATAAGTLTATVDRKELYVNEHVVLTLALGDSETRLRAEGVAPNVDLTVLSEQFELGTPRADFRFNIDRNRGRATSSITVALFPRRSGRLTIPAFTVDGVSSEPVSLRVLAPPADAAAEVFAISGVDRRILLPREQTRVWIDLYHRVDLDSAQLGGPVDTRPREVEMHLLPQENRVEEVDGISYEVTRTAWALSPLTTDGITVLLPDIWVETGEGRRWRLPFSDEHIEVGALPDDLPPGTLIGRPEVGTSTPEKAETGRMTPWEITLRTRTALNALPAELPFRSHDGTLRIFMDPPERRLETGGDGDVVSVGVYRGSVMPLAPGDYALPEIALPWFDPERREQNLFVLPGPALQVSGDPLATAAGGQAAAGAVAMRDTGDTRIWQALAALLGTAWLVTLVLWWRGRPDDGRRGPRPRGVGNPGDPLRDRLIAALGGRTLEQGLRRHESIFGVDETLRTVVRDVQRHCYHPESKPAESEQTPDLATRVDRAIERLRREPPPRQSGDADPWSPRAFRRADRER